MIKGFEYPKELEKKLWQVGHTVFWTISSVILFTIAIDIFFLTNMWFEFVVLKLVLLLFFYFSYNFFKNKNTTPNALIHIILFGLNFLSLISISEATGISKYIYITILIASFVSFNGVVIWKVTNSLFQYLSTILIFVALVILDKIQNPEKFLLEGGYLFLLLGFLSLFLPRIREVILKEKITTRMRIEHKNEALRDELYNLKTKYALLKEKVDKKDNESKFFFQQISKNLNEILQTAENSSKDEKNSAEKLLNLVENLRNQSSVYFKPIEINTSNSKEYTADVVNLEHVYKTIFKSFENKITESGVLFSEQINCNNPHILGNEKMLKTIVFNILNFIVIFSQKDDEIKIDVQNIKDDIILSFSNQNKGLNSLEIESYFRDLEYVNYDYKKHSDSIKIGLRISKQLTQKMNGYFSYVSSEKLGLELKLQFKTHK